jgi:hypothetical protein
MSTMNQEYDDCSNSVSAQASVKAEDVNLNASLKITIRIKSDTKETALSFNDMTYIANIRRCSEYLDEVFRIAEESDHLDEVILEEKDVNLAAEFLLKLAKLGHEDDNANEEEKDDEEENGDNGEEEERGDTAADDEEEEDDYDTNPNLSYDLDLAELAIKWIVDECVTHFKNYIDELLDEFCDVNQQPVNVTLNGLGVVEPLRLTPAGTTSVYCSDNIVVEKFSKPGEWSPRYHGSKYSISATSDTESLHQCSGEWKDISASVGAQKCKPPRIFHFELQLVDGDDERLFIKIVKCIQAHEEYRQGTIFETMKLSDILFDYPHLRTKNILKELMNSKQLVQFALCFGTSTP